MFMGPLEATLPWSNSGLDGTKKWIERVERCFLELNKLSDVNDHSLDKVYHATVKKVTHDIETLNFNTAVSQMMIFINECYKVENIYKDYALGFIKMFNCFAPHMGEELWFELSGQEGISYSTWPSYDESYLIEDEIEMVFQINGKIKAKAMVPFNSDQKQVEEIAKQLELLQSALKGQTIRKVIHVKNKLLNIVI